MAAMRMTRALAAAMALLAAACARPGDEHAAAAPEAVAADVSAGRAASTGAASPLAAAPNGAAAPAPPPAESPPPAAPAGPPTGELGGGMAGVAGLGDPRIGRRFALDNCRPCHVVAADQGSPVRFANAPDLRVIARRPETTRLKLNIWLTNPHPTMPTLRLTPEEAADVIAYIMSLRG
jgi:mono/diheme cytochrome c family protein